MDKNPHKLGRYKWGSWEEYCILMGERITWFFMVGKGEVPLSYL